MPYTGGDQPCDFKEPHVSPGARLGEMYLEATTPKEDRTYAGAPPLEEFIELPLPKPPQFLVKAFEQYHERQVDTTVPELFNHSGIDKYDPGVPKGEQGVKYDMEKPDYSLLPPYALEDVVKVLTLGSQKYSRDNWKLLKNARMRYFAAAMRHLWARFRGEITDPESGIDHGAHAVCCILFMMEMTHENIDP